MSKRIPLDIRNRKEIDDADYVGLARLLFPGKFPQIQMDMSKWTHIHDSKIAEKIKANGQWEMLREMVAEKAIWIPGIVDGCNMAGQPYSVVFPVGKKPGEKTPLSGNGNKEFPIVHKDVYSHSSIHGPYIEYVQVKAPVSEVESDDRAVTMMGSKCYALAFPSADGQKAYLFFQYILNGFDDTNELEKKQSKYAYPIEYAVTPEEAEAMLIGMRMVGCQEMRVCDLCQFAQDFPGGELDETGILMKDKKAMQEIIDRYDEDAVVDAGVRQISEICETMLERDSQSSGMRP